MSDKLEDVWLKIYRAREHINHVVMLIDTYLDTEPYQAIREYSLNDLSKERIKGIVIKKEPPKNIALVMGEAIQSLRTSLDYLVYVLVAAANIDNPYSKRYSFPIYMSKEDFTKNTKNEKDVGIGAFKTIEQLQPYHNRGNDFTNHPLWLLCKLSNIDKHRRLNLVNFYNTSVTRFDWSVPPKVFDKIIGDATPTDQNAVIMLTYFFDHSIPSNTDMKMYLQNSLFVTIQEKEYFGGALVEELLNKLIEFVQDSVIPRFEEYL